MGTFRAVVRLSGEETKVYQHIRPNSKGVFVKVNNTTRTAKVAKLVTMLKRQGADPQVVYTEDSRGPIAIITTGSLDVAVSTPASRVTDPA